MEEDALFVDSNTKVTLRSRPGASSRVQIVSSSVSPGVCGATCSSAGAFGSFTTTILQVAALTSAFEPEQVTAEENLDDW